MPETEQLVQNAVEVVTSDDDVFFIVQNAPEFVSDSSPNTHVIAQNAIEIVYGEPDSPTITSLCPLPPAEEGVPYTYTFLATGGTPPYLWGIISGSLPSGLSLSTSGVITGTPVTVGPFQFTIVVVSS